MAVSVGTQLGRELGTTNGLVMLPCQALPPLAFPYPLLEDRVRGTGLKAFIRAVATLVAPRWRDPRLKAGHLAS